MEQKTLISANNSDYMSIGQLRSNQVCRPLYISRVARIDLIRISDMNEMVLVHVDCHLEVILTGERSDSSKLVVLGPYLVSCNVRSNTLVRNNDRLYLGMTLTKG